MVFFNSGVVQLIFCYRQLANTQVDRIPIFKSGLASIFCYNRKMKHSTRSLIFGLILALAVPCLAIAQEGGGTPAPSPTESASATLTPTPTPSPTSNPTDEPGCGDGRCDGEDCKSCPSDCGTCSCAEDCSDGICCDGNCLTGASSCPSNGC